MIFDKSNIKKFVLFLLATVIFFVFITISFSCCRKNIRDIQSESGKNIIATIKVESCKKIFVKGDKAYTLNAFMGLQVIDIKDKETPFKEKLVKAPWPRDLFIVDDFIYIADYADGLIVVDISDKNDPKIVNRIEALKQSTAIYCDNNLLYVASQYTSYKKKYGNMTIYDISDRKNPIKTGECKELSGISDIIVKGNLAYLTFNDFGKEESGLMVIDVADVKRPELVSKLISPGFLTAITVKDDYIFVADFREGLKIFDTKDPNKLVQIDTSYIKNKSTDASVSDGFLYISDGYSGIKKIDISDINDLKIIEEVKTSSFAEGLFIYEDFIYVADNDYFTIINKF